MMALWLCFFKNNGKKKKKKGMQFERNMKQFQHYTCSDTVLTRLQNKGHFAFIFINKTSGMKKYIYVKANMINNVRENKHLVNLKILVS
jgi:hypothetical protein